MTKQHLQLSEADRLELSSMASRTSLTVKTHSRVQILLALDSGRTYRSIITEYRTNYPTVSRLVASYQERGISCLYDKPRSGRPPEITGEQRSKLTALACTKAPVGYAKWTLRMLADKAVELEICESISHSHVRKILKKTSYSHISSAHGVSAH
jgi:transposase